MIVHGYEARITGDCKPVDGRYLHSLVISKEGDDILFQSGYGYDVDNEGYRKPFSDARGIIDRAVRLQKRDKMPEEEAFAQAVKSAALPALPLGGHSKVEEPEVESEEKQKRQPNWARRRHVANILNLILVPLFILASLAQLAILPRLTENSQVFAVLFAVVGVLAGVVMLAWGVFLRNKLSLASQGLTKGSPESKGNLLRRDADIATGSSGFTEDERTGWYSIVPLVTLVFCVIFGAGIALGGHGTVRLAAVAAVGLIFLVYVAHVLWEVAEYRLCENRNPIIRTWGSLLIVVVICLLVYLFIFVI